ncbi:MAG: hypothetical protein PHG00_16720 [Methylococcales bacterium]|nr:hypothetical protein [Methylococcales bacterium]
MTRIKDLFDSLLAQDMGKQARQVEYVTAAVLLVMLLTIGLLWQYKLTVIVRNNSGGQVPTKMNVFELLLKK